VGRIEDDRLMIDLRTVLREEEDDLGRRLQQLARPAAAPNPEAA
jgi:hypothetical protein